MGHIVAITGKGRSGKDTVAGMLVGGLGFTRIGLADPMKRFCAEVFGFTHEQLHGNERDLPDSRYPRAFETVGSDPATRVEVATSHLTPRYALQTLGTEWGRNCYRDIWVNAGINTARTLLADHAMAYSATTGLYTKTPWNQDMVNRGVVFSDIRFHSELAAMRRAGAITVFIDRPAEARGALAGVPDHASEREMDEMDQSAFDVVLHNVGTILDLNEQVVERLIPLLK